MRTIAALLIALALNLSAATYYVDPDAGDNANDGTAQGTAWKNLPGTWGATGTTGWSLIPSNSVVLVKGGTTHTNTVWFDNNWYTNSAGYDGIVIKSGDLEGWGTGRAVIDCMTNVTIGLALGASNFTQGITVWGFEVRNAKHGPALPFDATGGNSCIWVGSSAYGISHCVVRDCYLHHAFRLTADDGTSRDRGHGIESVNSTNCVFESNYIAQVGTKGIEIYRCKDNVVRANFVTKTGDHSIVVSGRNNDIYNNLIWGGPSEAVMSGATLTHVPTLAIKIVGGPAPGFAGFNDVWNNVIYHEFNTGTNWASGIGLYLLASSNRIINNTIAYVGAGSAGGGEYGPSLSIGNENNLTTNNLVANNILFRSLNWNNVKNAFWMLSNGTYNATITKNAIAFTNNATDLVATVGRTGVGHLNMTVSDFDARDLLFGSDAYDNVQAMPVFVGGSFPTGFSGGVPDSSYFYLSVGNDARVVKTDNPYQGGGGFGHSQETNKFVADILGVNRVNWTMGAYEYPDLDFAGLLVAPSSVSFTALTNSVPEDFAYGIMNNGDQTQTVDYTNSESSTWFSMSLDNGSVTSEIDSNVLSFDLTGLASGAYTNQVTTIGYTNGVSFLTQQFTVTLTVINPPPSVYPVRARIGGRVSVH